MIDSEKIESALRQASKGKEKRTIICKKAECIIVCQQNTKKYKLGSEDIEIQQVKKFNYLDSVVTTQKSEDTQKSEGTIAKDTFQNLIIKCEKKENNKHKYASGGH